MDEVWEDINLSSLHRPTPTFADATNPDLPGVILQDFLASPFNKDPSTKQSDHCNGHHGAKARPPAATALRLNSAPAFHHLEDTDSERPPSFPPSFGSSFTALAFSTSAPSFSKKKAPESDESFGDRLYKRMMKNRESATRSRARKQAYINELEGEVAHLLNENAKLRRQQDKVCWGAPGQPTKHKLQRTSSSPF